MKNIHSSDLKTILHSKRANIYYLEHCRVLVHGGRVEYVTDAGKQSLYWNIPIANTTSILLGTGTSITQAAMRELGKAGVMVGFCGGGGTPLYCTNEQDVAVSWLSPQSEYRPTQYLQAWVHFWFTDYARLNAAKAFQYARLQYIEQYWSKPKTFGNTEFPVDHERLHLVLNSARSAIANVADSMTLLTEEARLSKELYKLAAQAAGYGQFTRTKRGNGTDPANRLLDHGNYLAYGLGATATWVLGIPHGLAVMHGKTRRGGLVFDVADLVKDALVMPQAFLSAMSGDDEQTFRQACIDVFTRCEALDFMIETVKDVALNTVRSTE